MKRVIILLFLIISFGFNTYAQIIGSMLNDEQYGARVKLVDEFLDRFNGIEDRPDINKNDSDYHFKRLLVLFNGKMFNSLTDSTFIAAKEFIETINKNTVKLDYTDSLWYANATCHGKFKGKEVVFTLYLTVEHRKSNMYKWVISKAEGDIFSLKPSKESEKIMMMPDDHETNFLSLHRITNEKDDLISNYIRKDHLVDKTSVFLSYVYNGWLNIDYVSDLSFTFLQVPGYEFSIKEFEREGNNVGWLISGFNILSEEQKRNKIKFIYE